MSLREIRVGEWWNSSVLTELCDGQRRQALAILINSSEPVDEQDLATRLIAIVQEKPLIDVTKEAVETAHAELRHSHLPALVDADLIIWDRADATQTTTDHPMIQDPRFKYVVEQQGEDWDEVMANLIVERRRIVLAILEAHDEPMSKSTLARDVAIHEDDANPSSDEIEQTMSSLYHIHLPKLHAAGLIEYDPDDEIAAYRGHPKLDNVWFDARPDEKQHAGLRWSAQ